MQLNGQLAIVTLRGVAVGRYAMPMLPALCVLAVAAAWGLAPKRWLFATLVWIGAACAFLVPELGPEVVLSLLLIPGTLIRPVATTLGMHSILSGAIGAASVIVAFVLSTSMNWPVEPTITVVLIGLAWSVRQGGRWIFPSATSKQSPLPAERP